MSIEPRLCTGGHSPYEVLGRVKEGKNDPTQHGHGSANTGTNKLDKQFVRSIDTPLQSALLLFIPLPQSLDIAIE